MPTNTTTYSFQKPVVGADEDSWGGYLNSNWDKVDDLFDGTTAITGIDINSGTIDGTVIGGSSAAAGTFTTLTASTSITGTLATAAQPNVTSLGTLTSLALSGDMTFGDNDKAIFGAGSDLQIYHDGTHSRVNNNTGDLFLQSPTVVRITNSTASETAAKFFENGAVELYHDNSKKLATTSTGVDITGTLTSDGLTVTTGAAGTLATFTDGVNSNFVIETASLITTVGNTGGSTALAFKSSNTERIRLDSSGSVGIGTSLPSNPLHVTNSSSTVATGYFNNTSVGGDSPALIAQGGANNAGSVGVFEVRDYGGNTDFYVGGTGNVGIGTSSPAQALEVNTASGDAYMRVERANQTTGQVGVQIGGGTSSTDWFTYMPASSDDLAFFGNSQERMRIQANGATMIGTTSQNGNGGLTVTPSSGGSNSGAAQIYFNRSTTAGTTYALIFNNASTAVGNINYTNTTTTYATSSDYRLKEEWQPMTGASERVLALKPVNFAWKVDGTRVDGFLAHEVQEVVPEAVTGAKDAMRTQDVYDENGNVIGTKEVPDYQGIDQSKLVPLLTAALQEALAKIDALETRISALEGN